MTPSTRQTGAVHIMFLIITLVVAIAGWALWFTEYSDNEKKTQDAIQAKAEADRAADVEVMLRSGFEEVAGVVGGITTKLPEVEDTDDRSTYLTKIRDSFIPILKKQIDRARARFKADANMVDLYSVMVPAEAMVNALETRIQTLETELATAKAAKASAEKANDDMVTAHNSELAAKNDTARQLRETHATKEQLLESQKSDLAASVSDLTDRYENQISTSTEQITALKNAEEAHDRDVRSLKTEIRTKRERNLPDGNISVVNRATGTCYIDIGSRHGLRRGTRFNTYGFTKGRVKEYHGYIVVTDVERDRALCALEDGAQPNNGDYVTSPIFERDGAMTFHFIGNLPGRFTNQQAKSILEQYGMKVADEFSIFVDFVVLGSNPDPEAIGDDANPNWFKETEAYNDAIRWGVEMIRAEDLENYLKY